MPWPEQEVLEDRVYPRAMAFISSSSSSHEARPSARAAGVRERVAQFVVLIKVLHGGVLAKHNAFLDAGPALGKTAPRKCCAR